MRTPAPLILTLLAAAPLTAQVPLRGTAEGPQLDPLAQKTLRAWEDLEYHAGRAGVTRVSFTIKLQGQSKMQGKISANGAYKYDGRRGTLIWKPNISTLTRQLASEGWAAASIDRLWQPEARRRSLAGTRLVGGETADGVVIRVIGDNPRGLTSMHFDKRGVCTQWVLARKDQADRVSEVTIKHRYKQVGKRYLRCGWTMAMPTPAGQVLASTEVDHLQLGRFWLFRQVRETVRVSGKPFSSRQVDFSQYKVNDHLNQAKPPTGLKKPGTKKD